MTIVDKIKECIEYSKEQKEKSGGKDLENISVEDFEEMLMVVDTMLDGYEE